MLVLGLDLETSGLNSETDEIIEIGAVVWDVNRAKPLQFMSRLIKTGRPIEPQVEQITGLTSADLERFGVDLAGGLAELKVLSDSCDYVVAHNGQGFDKKFLERAWTQFPDSLFERAWIDTMYDLPISDRISTRKLDYLAAEHGFINPFSHRAVFDVLTMLKIMAQYSFADILQLHQSPLVRVVAQVSYEEKDKAKDLGFRWDPKQRVWYSEMKQIVLEQKQGEFPFSTVVM